MNRTVYRRFHGGWSQGYQVKKSKGFQPYRIFTLDERIDGTAAKKAESMLTHFIAKKKSVQSRQLGAISPATKPKHLPMNPYVTTTNKRKRPYILMLLIIFTCIE